jgi:phenylpropionate dioxygenase-like ring-hydroxylating dioxygenase large terminal subunit
MAKTVCGLASYHTPQINTRVGLWHGLRDGVRLLDRFATKVHHACNYLQANEGNIDPTHLSFLHRTWEPQGDAGRGYDVPGGGLFGTERRRRWRSRRPITGCAS